MFGIFGGIVACLIGGYFGLLEEKYMESGIDDPWGTRVLSLVFVIGGMITVIISFINLVTDLFA